MVIPGPWNGHSGVGDEKVGARQSTPPWLQTGLMPDVELSELAERIGPQWSMGRSTKNGFEFRFGLMDGGK